MNEWKDGRMDGWMDGWMDGRTDGRTDGRMHHWIVRGGKALYTTDKLGNMITTDTVTRCDD